MHYFKNLPPRSPKVLFIAYPAFVCVFLFFEVRFISAYLSWVQPIGRLFDTPGCTMPLYPSFHRTIRRANETDTSLQWRCPGRRATVIYRRGSVLYMNMTRLASYYGVTTATNSVCTFREVMRNESSGVNHDWGFSLGPTRPLVFGTTLSEEFVAVTCAVGKRTLFTDYFLLPQRKSPTLKKRVIRGERPISVLVLGIDSTSRMNFDRHMKRTRRLLTEELFAFEFLGYNKVGESSFGNQIPLLTGLAGDDVERLFRNHTFDELPHLWSVYKESGYTTLFLEEMPDYGLFVYPDFRGFRNPPTDYYPLPAVYAMGVQRGLDDYCAGSRLKAQVNQRRLVTAYDLHATLLALSRYPRGAFEPSLSTQRGISLFGRVPPERSCGDAFVSAQFCECQGSHVDLDERSALVQSFAGFVVELLNTRNEANFPGLCIKWKLAKVTDASALGGQVIGKVLLRALVTTTPEAHFEAYGLVRNGTYQKVDLVQRLDWYSNQTRCLPPSVFQLSVRRRHLGLAKYPRSCLPGRQATGDRPRCKDDHISLAVSIGGPSNSIQGESSRKTRNDDVHSRRRYDSTRGHNLLHRLQDMCCCRLGVSWTRLCTVDKQRSEGLSASRMHQLF
ncbi:uncharacterized protein [Dermacentor albipictus]|uniref:uncharacterized protein isoform X2 n=1 Tax=Dermacentor albipictus TaxID=60249 RepID=UPI0031FD79BB